MKKLILVFGLTLFYLMPRAQDKTQTMSDVEQFCKAPGRTVIGYLIYKDTYGFELTGITAKAMKYVDSATKNTIFGITFSGSINNASGNTSFYKYYEAMVDYAEISTVISWLESYQWVINSADTTIGYLSYTPQKGNFLLKLQRRLGRKGSVYSSKHWDFAIQFNKYDIDSEKTFSIEMATVIEKLKELRRMIGK
jgi:hypothetical protein